MASSRLLSVLALAAAASTDAYEFGKFDGPEGWLADHNYFRCMHDAKPLYWSARLEAAAQEVADGLAAADAGLKHSPSYGTVPYSGENLAWGYGTFTCNGIKMPYGQHCAVSAWYSEYTRTLTCDTIDDWRNVPGAKGHFTAMAWKGISLLGCAKSGRYYVCRYSHELCLDGRTAACVFAKPAHLPNFNMATCAPRQCFDCLKEELRETCSRPEEPSTTLVPSTMPITTTTLVPSTMPITTTTLLPTTKSATTATTTKPTTTTTKPTTTTTKPTTTTTTTTPTTTTTTTAPTTTTTTTAPTTTTTTTTPTTTTKPATSATTTKTTTTPTPTTTTMSTSTTSTTRAPTTTPNVTTSKPTSTSKGPSIKTKITIKTKVSGNASGNTNVSVGTNVSVKTR